MIVRTFRRIYTLLIVVGLLHAISCTKQQNDIGEELVGDPVSFLALGDSYTIGQGVAESQRWPIQLGERLEENDFEIEGVEIIAQTGWTTNDLLNGIANTKLEEYNLVSLSIGVNNQFQGRPFEIFESEFDSLLNRSICLAGSKERVFVVSIPDYGVTPFGSSNSESIGEEIDMYNNYISNTCDMLEIPFIDITEISRTLGDSPGALASDNLHPSGSQYEAWTNEILPVVIEILNK